MAPACSAAACSVTAANLVDAAKRVSQRPTSRKAASLMPEGGQMHLGAHVDSLPAMLQHIDRQCWSNRTRPQQDLQDSHLGDNVISRNAAPCFGALYHTSKLRPMLNSCRCVYDLGCVGYHRGHDSCRQTSTSAPRTGSQPVVSRSQKRKSE